MNVNENKKPYVTIDIAKFVMAILVVAIHVRPFSGEAAFVYDDIVARVADPLFFQITAFLFFEKVFRKDKDIRMASKDVILAEARPLHATYSTTVYGMVYSVCSCGMLSDGAGTGDYL